MDRFNRLYQRLFNFWLVILATVASLKIYGSLTRSPLPAYLPAGPISPSSTSIFSLTTLSNSLQTSSPNPQLPAWLKEMDLTEESRLVGVLNRVGQKELTEVKGIGELLAGRIISLRDQRGGFTHLAELFEVDGIGNKRALAIVDWLKTKLSK